MTIVFYILGALACLGGGHSLYLANTTAVDAVTGAPVDLSFYSTFGIQALFLGVLLLGIGGALRRLDRIVHYSRMTALAIKEAAGK